MCRKIETIGEFQNCKKSGKYIVITDKPRKNTVVHKNDCPYVTIENFKEKVEDNKEENGSYYCCDTLDEAENSFNGVEKCKKCF